MRKAYVGVTDFDWYSFLSSRPDLTEVNFWQPGGTVRFKALSQGELFLFKLHSPNNYIVGGGFFSASSLLPVSIAWETFGPMNGVASLPEMRRRIAKYRREELRPGDDPTIGNIVLTGAFFLRREAWIPIPNDFSLNIVQGKTYDLDVGTGRELGAALQLALQHGQVSLQRMVAEGEVARMFSDPLLARRRLGQGGFRLLITESFERQCAVTREHTLPVLDAAHIRPVTQQGQHAVNNGLLLRSDVHTLFDRGYVTVTPDYKFRVSRRLDEEWQNGKVYYALDKKPIHLPRRPDQYPDSALLEWHAETIFIK
jgi:putative restriction endonuclease